MAWRNLVVTAKSLGLEEPGEAPQADGAHLVIDPTQAFSESGDSPVVSPRTLALAAAPLKAPPDSPQAVARANVGIFWDFENVRVPGNKTTAGAVDAVRGLALKQGNIVEQRLYYDSREANQRNTDRTNLDMSGFTLVDCPKRHGVKETLDKRLIVDMMKFLHVHDNHGQKLCVVLITSDGDYSYALNVLRGFNVKTLVIYGAFATTAGALLDSADVAVSFADLVNPKVEDPEDPMSSTNSTDGASVADEAKSEAETVAEEAEEGRYLVYLNCVEEVCGGNNNWTVDAKIGSHFHQKQHGFVDKVTLKTGRDAAIRGGFVEAGRVRTDGSGSIEPVPSAYYADLGVLQKLALSKKQIYMRLTPEGRNRLSAQWTRPGL